MERRKKRNSVLLKRGTEGREQWKKRAIKVKGFKVVDPKIILQISPWKLQNKLWLWRLVSHIWNVGFLIFSWNRIKHETGNECLDFTVLLGLLIFWHTFMIIYINILHHQVFCSCPQKSRFPRKILPPQCRYNTFSPRLISFAT